MAGTKLLICALLFALDSAFAENVKSKIVTINQGPVKGYKFPGRNVFVFYGIPYATSPTGPNKFKAPLLPPTWIETFEAVDNHIFCPQVLTPFLPKNVLDEEEQIENCLIVNVYVPDTEKTNLPVVVYVHGGGYQVGQGNLLTPVAMVSEGEFIAVNFNYRLGALGFLCLGTEDVPGNAGMKDQVALLQWVQKNIASFGGNPEDVTLTGFSAGSSAVELLMLSEITKGLFHKVIPESGSGLSVWSVQIDPIENAKSFARKFNITSDDVQDLEEFYKNASIEELTAHGIPKLKDATFLFVPCIERETGTEQFLKEAPTDIMKSGNYTKMPVLIGFTNMEGLFRAPVFSEWKDDMNTNFSVFLPADMEFRHDMQKEEVGQIIKKFYFGEKPVSNDTIEGYTNYFTDVMFAYSTIRSVNLQLEAGNNDVFLYVYSYLDGLLTPPPLPFNLLRGANHCAQTSALLEFPALGLDGSSDSAENKRMKSTMRKLWINFIKTGKPLPEATDAFPKGWPAVSSARSSYMALSSVSELKEDNLLGDRFELWNSLYRRHYRTPVPPTGA